MNTIEEHGQKALEKLEEIKNLVVLFAMDFDGTLADGGEFTKEKALSLIEEIIEAGKIPAFITARAATAVKSFVPHLEGYYNNHQSAGPTYIAGGNGTVLYKLTSKSLEKIYNHGLTLDEVKHIVSVWKTYAEENLPVESLSEKGLTTFQKFYSETWDNLIPSVVLNIGREFNGRIFTEEAKVTFVFPKDISLHSKIVDNIQQLIGEGFSVTAGDKDFCHITKSLHDDTKLVGVQKILELENLAENQVVTFGDMPHGNDAGLLSFPNSFTNYSEIISQKEITTPPYVLPEDGLFPVARVHKAIHYLLHK